MGIFDERDTRIARGVSRISGSNPFLPERIDAERETLGEEYVPIETQWHARGGSYLEIPNVALLSRLSTETAERVRQRLVDGESASPDELRLYEDAFLFALYHEFVVRIDETIRHSIGPDCTSASRKAKPITYYDEFVERLAHYTRLTPTLALEVEAPHHLFALFFHLRRAFYQIFVDLVGTSLAMANLRAAIWQSIFTHDLRRYRRALYDRMGDVTTLITGPSGTGKELVARAIGRSRYVSFDPKKGCFAADFAQNFYPLNLSALSSTLIESELFGHRRGSFTGALDDHAGWFQVCGPWGSVFLDEVGDLDVAIQVKLLRVLQTRTFQRLGDTGDLRFEGKIVAATNRNLASAIEEGQFREDFYYRLCADRIETPTLAAQLAANPDELRNLVSFIAGRLLGDPDTLVDEVVEWVETNVGFDYGWPGNFRELEQCVRNIMVRGEYRPEHSPRGDAGNRLGHELSAGTLTAEEVLRRYCTLVYAKNGSYEGTARVLGIDRRTVKAKIDPDFLAELQAGTN